MSWCHSTPSEFLLSPCCHTWADLAAKRGHSLNVFIHWQQKLDLKTVILMLSWSFPCFPSVKVTILRHDDHRHPSPTCSHQDNDVHSVQRGVQGLQPVHCLYGVTRGAQSWNGKGKRMCLLLLSGVTSLPAHAQLSVTYLWSRCTGQWYHTGRGIEGISQMGHGPWHSDLLISPVPNLLFLAVLDVNSAQPHTELYHFIVMVCLHSLCSELNLLLTEWHVSLK